MLSKLNVDDLRKVAELGHGAYSRSDHFSLSGASAVNGMFGVGTDYERAGKSTITWEPRFYVFLIPMLFFLLPLFRRRSSGTQSAAQPSREPSRKNGADQLAVASLVAALFCLAPHARADEGGIVKMFNNQATLGKDALVAKDYDTAAALFTDPHSAKAWPNIERDSSKKPNNPFGPRIGRAWP